MTSDSMNGLAADSIIIHPLNGKLQVDKNSQFQSKSTEKWLNIFPNAAYFGAYDETLFGHIVIIVYENPDTEKICTVSITKFGVTMYNDLILNGNSRFYPSCENLLPIHRNSKVRKALAITNLKNYNKLINNPGEFIITKRWDETNAGTLASKMTLLIDKKPNEFGNKLLQMGLVTNHSMKSMIMDVVYDNQNDPKIIDSNNKLVYLLGDQLDQLFDPLLEYSPETLENTYNIPNPSNSLPAVFHNNENIQLIVNELLTLQTNYTTGLVSLLQNFIVPLRIHILSATESNTNGIATINHVFPPTIDEITRINCVLHDSLLKAKSFGYIEIFKVFGMILPYFYKPFIRHEANLKNFKPRFNKFYSKYEDKLFKNSLVNKSSFSNNYIDSIITGSLLELPKLKLVLNRLYDTINGLSAESNNAEELSIINYHYEISMKIIDAFGGDNNEISQQQHFTNHERLTSKTRIFTPTGKILTELASKWPPQLQYGWLIRKVIGIYELKNVKPDNNYYDLEIMIIFLDMLLFLKIIDDAYYVNDGSNQRLISVSDILMHSLVNEKPLPTLSSFPKMEVSHWCSIRDVVVTTYKSFSSTTSLEENYLRLFQKNSEPFQCDQCKELVKNYEILVKSNDTITGHSIIELINKAKILSKCTPFHLFRTNMNNLHIYSLAHEAKNYDNEKIKSPILILLNLPQEMVEFYFQQYPHIFMLFTVSFTYEGQIQLLGFSRNMDPQKERTSVLEVNAIVDVSEFQSTLQYNVTQVANAYFNSFTPITQLMIKANDMDLEYYLMGFQKFNSFEVREQRKLRLSIIQEQEREQEREQEQEATNVKLDKPEALQGIKNLEERKVKRRKSIFRKLFGKKIKVEDSEIKYKELYLPTPKLEKKSTLELEKMDSKLDLVKKKSKRELEKKESKPRLEKKDTEPILANIEIKPQNSVLYKVKDEASTLQLNPRDHGDVGIVRDRKINNQDSQESKIVGTSTSQQALFTESRDEIADNHKDGIKELTNNNHEDSIHGGILANVVIPAQVESVAIHTSETQDTTNKLLDNKLHNHKNTLSAYKSRNPTNPFVNKGEPTKLISKEEPTTLISKGSKFKELYDSSEDSINYKNTTRINPTHITLEDEKETNSNVRVPSLEVNSQFEFPLTKQVIRSSQGSLQESNRGSLIKSISESKFTDNEPFEVFSDDEANWIVFSRDSSQSSLDDKSSDTKHYPLPKVPHELSHSGRFSNQSREVSLADSFKEQIQLFNNQILSSFSNNLYQSDTSSTPSETIYSFGKSMERNFSSTYRRNTVQTKGVQTDQKPTTKLRRNNSDAHEIAKRYSGFISEDEYYSPPEYISPEPSPTVKEHQPHSSFSSESTIINELGDDVYLAQFESMAYLSDILNGKIEIDI